MGVSLDFYDRVKDLAHQKNVNLKTFIETCGLNYDSYNSCKRYGNLPRSEEAVKIAKALNTSVEYLVTGIDASPYMEENRMLKEKIQRAIEDLK